MGCMLIFIISSVQYPCMLFPFHHYRLFLFIFVRSTTPHHPNHICPHIPIPHAYLRIYAYSLATFEGEESNTEQKCSTSEIAV